MKIVAVGDAYITPEMMRSAVERVPEMNLDATYLFFGEEDREQMRDTVRQIEHGAYERLPLPDGYLDAVKDAEILMIHLCPVTRQVLEAAPNLKYILLNRGGIENVDIQAATERGIMVLHNPAHNANAVAEYTVGLILCETRNIARADASLKRGDWREEYPNTSTNIRELHDMTVGIIGFGSVGRLLLERLESFRCKVLIYDPYLEVSAFDILNAEFVTLPELLKQADVITLHARASSPILTRNEFAMMKPTSYLINTARACLVNTRDLADALKEHRIMGAAIDVFDTEPEIPDLFYGLDNVTITNHRGGDTIESYSDSPEMMLRNLLTHFNGRRPMFWVNKPKRA